MRTKTLTRKSAEGTGADMPCGFGSVSHRQVIERVLDGLGWPWNMEVSLLIDRCLASEEDAA